MTFLLSRRPATGVANYFDTTGRRYDSPQVYFSTCVELMRIMKEQLLHAHMMSLWVVGAEGDPLHVLSTPN